MDRGRTAFVLAGGGAKGAFEAGAIRYLVEERAITPDVVTAASAGAIAGSVIAQARTPEEFVLRARQLRDDLLAMTHTELLFGTQPWMAALHGTRLGTAIDQLLTDRTRPPAPEDGLGPTVGGVPTAPGSGRRAIAAGLALLRTLPRLRRARRGLRGNAGSIMTLEPLAEALRLGGPSGIHRVDPALIARPGLDLRLAVTALQAGRLRYVTGSGDIVEDDALTPVAGAGAGPVDLIEAVIASSSVPMVFPPRPLADDVYVDGGVLQNIPVLPALRLGADRIFAVVAVPLEQPPDRRDYTTANAIDVFLRALSAIAFSERQKADVAQPLPPGATLTVIDPTVDVVGPFEVSQGLMLLDMDYGWCRAADLLAEVSDATRAAGVDATDAIVTARTLAWHREEELWARGRASGPDLDPLLKLKQTVRDALTERRSLGLPVPKDADAWWRNFEVHAGPRPPEVPELGLELSSG
ncbi:MAG TPA: patatin-like phospholipase family protein [Acidimicrobiales bacterium]|jgi:predicted acylesterase/phospholipase RssA